MSSSSPRERLSKLVELAAETDLAARRALVDGLADLLLDWPAAYPSAMREPFEVLLEKSLRNVEPGLRGELAERFVGRTDTPLHLLNLLVFDAAPEIKCAILLRNALAREARSGAGAASEFTGEATLLAAARASLPDVLPGTLASRLAIAPDIAAQILLDASGWMLATLCKGAGFRRATFSALAMLAHADASPDESYRRLAAYDAVPLDGASALVAFWRAQIEPARPAAQAA
jgi:hypothetical protein